MKPRILVVWFSKYALAGRSKVRSKKAMTELTELSTQKIFKVDKSWRISNRENTPCLKMREIHDAGKRMNISLILWSIWIEKFEAPHLWKVDCLNIRKIEKFLSNQTDATNEGTGHSNVCSLSHRNGPFLKINKLTVCWSENKASQILNRLSSNKEMSRTSFQFDVAAKNGFL